MTIQIWANSRNGHKPVRTESPPRADETGEKGIEMKEIEQVRAELNKRTDRSAWDKGVTDYAVVLLDNVETAARYGRPFETINDWRAAMLNGASDWVQYSYGGCALMYDCDIANRLCTPSELKRKRNGELNPNSRETWLDVQARALNQACYRIIKILRMELGFKRV